MSTPPRLATLLALLLPLAATAAPVASDPAAVADRKALEALLPAEAARTPLVNDMSGEPVGLQVALAAPRRIAGVPCRRVVNVEDEGWGCELSERWSAEDRTSKAGSWLQLHYGTGKRAALVFEDLEPVPASLEIGGVPCADFAHFHPGGELATTMLAQAHTFGKDRMPKGAQVTLRPDGTLAEAVAYEPVLLRGKEHPAGTFTFDEDGGMSVQEGSFGD